MSGWMLATNVSNGSGGTVVVVDVEVVSTGTVVVVVVVEVVVVVVAGSATTESDAPPNVAAYSHLEPALAADFDELTTRPVSHTVREAAWLTARVVVAPTHGQTGENLVVQIPDANVVIAGAMASFGAIPAA